jgi:hypothetical protein
VLLAAVLALVCGCSRPPQMGTENYRLVAGLRTAISTHRIDWLEAAAKEADKRHSAGGLSDEQFAQIEAIVGQARAGDWATAEDDVIRLEKAQQPSAEDIEKAKAKRAPPNHTP